MRKVVSAFLAVLVSSSVPAQSPQVSFATQFVSVPRGTILDVVGESNASGFGSGIAWSALMAQTSAYFSGRTGYRNFAALGATPANYMSQYTSGNGTVSPQADCHAAAAGGPPAFLIVESGLNGFVSAGAQFSATAAVWAQAKADGCTVFATTIPQHFGYDPNVMDFNAMVHSAATAGGGSNPIVASHAYDALIDLYAALPYDGCTNDTTGDCPVVADGHFADSGHVNGKGAAVFASYAASVIVTRGNTGAPALASVNYTPAVLYGGIAPVNGKDGALGVTACASGSVDITAALTPGSGNHFSLRNTGTLPCQVTVNTGIANVIFDTTGTATGPLLAPATFSGDQLDFLYDLPAGATQGVVHTVRHSPSAPAYQPAAATVIVATFTNQQIPGYADLFDTAGYQIQIDGGPNGPAINQSAPNHRVTLVNSASTASHFLSGVPINGGAGVADLQPHKMMLGVYLGPTAGWLLSPLP